MIEDTQDRQTQIYQTVEALVDDRQYHYETARLLDQEALVSQEAWVHSMGLSSAVYYELQGYKTHVWTQDHRMDVQDSLIVALTAQVSSLQGHLATALGEIEHFKLESRLVRMFPRAPVVVPSHEYDPTTKRLLCYKNCTRTQSKLELLAADVAAAACATANPITASLN
ncbi:hypothetical protein Tco_1401369 [Tanacetum coccineum]